MVIMLTISLPLCHHPLLYPWHLLPLLPTTNFCAYQFHRLPPFRMSFWSIFPSHETLLSNPPQNEIMNIMPCWGQIRHQCWQGHHPLVRFAAVQYCHYPYLWASWHGAGAGVWVLAYSFLPASRPCSRPHRQKKTWRMQSILLFFSWDSQYNDVLVAPVVSPRFL